MQSYAKLPYAVLSRRCGNLSRGLCGMPRGDVRVCCLKYSVLTGR